jgi:hypothetical protein
LKEGEVSAPILDQGEEGKKFKIVTVTNRIDEHAADYIRLHQDQFGFKKVNNYYWKMV